MRLRLRLTDTRPLVWAFYGLCLGLAVYFGLLLAGYYTLAAGLGIGLLWAMYAWMRAVDAARRGFVPPVVKTYPEGCTCVRGAFEDDPSCPHHGELTRRGSE